MRTDTSSPSSIKSTVRSMRNRRAVREHAEEFDYDGQHMQSAKYDMRCHGKFTLRLLMLPGKLCCLKLGNDAATGFQVVSTGLGEREIPRGASDEAHANLTLESCQVPADR